jgi:hypothetical protein
LKCLREQVDVEVAAQNFVKGAVDTVPVMMSILSYPETVAPGPEGKIKLITQDGKKIPAALNTFYIVTHGLEERVTSNENFVFHPCVDIYCR